MHARGNIFVIMLISLQHTVTNYAQLPVQDTKHSLSFLRQSILARCKARALLPFLPYTASSFCRFPVSQSSINR